VVTVIERVAGMVLTGWPPATTDRTVKPRNLVGVKPGSSESLSGSR
jgi:hypothetical protein